jgi:hypothetical protein
MLLQGHEQGVSGGVQQQHFSTAVAERGKNRETLFLQQHPSHQQIPSGAAMLQSTAAIAA